MNNRTSQKIEWGLLGHLGMNCTCTLIFVFPVIGWLGFQKNGQKNISLNVSLSPFSCQFFLVQPKAELLISQDQTWNV